MDADRTRLLRAGASLALDAVAAEVSDELLRRGVRSIVLKGPVVVDRLYDEGEYRPHEDIDLLVAPDAFGSAARELQELGFARAATSDYADVWTRAGDGATIDLHTTLAGLNAPAAVAWAALTAETEHLTVRGREVEILAPASFALLVAVHAAQHGPKGTKALDDLQRALERLPAETWRGAAVLAQRLDGLAAFGAGLRLVPGGSALADRLEVPAGISAKVALLSGSAPPTAPGLYRLGETHGMRNKAALLVDEVFPPAAFMHAVYPVARRGRLGLAAAYAWRPIWLLGHVVPALRAVRRAKSAGRT